jgi:hypothetical protein
VNYACLSICQFTRDETAEHIAFKSKCVAFSVNFYSNSNFQ